MTMRELVEGKFSAVAHERPVFLPDLRIWYEWQKMQNTMPARWHGTSLDDLCRDLSIPIWRSVRPWQVDSTYPVTTSEEGGERTTTMEVNGTVITSRWTRGPDGDWWQSEYPAKSVDDLHAVLAYVESRRYQVDSVVTEESLAEVGDDGVVMVDLPARPFSWLMLEMLGWSDGLMLLLDAEAIVAKVVETAEQQLQQLVAELAGSRATLFYSPDNLDGQFVSPSYFSEYLSESYAKSSQMLHEQGKRLLVHAGGPVRMLLEPIAEVEIDAVVGVCGPPQGDSPIAEAREKAGSNLVLIGGVPQDNLLPSVDPAELGRSIDRMLADSADDPRIIASIADHVPIDADMERLETAAVRLM